MPRQGLMRSFAQPGNGRAPVPLYLLHPPAAPSLCCSIPSPLHPSAAPSHCLLLPFKAQARHFPLAKGDMETDGMEQSAQRTGQTSLHPSVIMSISLVLSHRHVQLSLCDSLGVSSPSSRTLVLSLQPGYPSPQHSCSAFHCLLPYACLHRQTGLSFASASRQRLPVPCPAIPVPAAPRSPALCPLAARGDSHRSVGFLLPSMFGCFAWLRRALHMHRVYDVKEIFHHSHALQRDALRLRQSICPLQQRRQV